jgi:NADH-quinone oxidoreductase subunit L
MNSIISLFLYIPLLGFIVSLFISEKKEGALSVAAFTTVGLNLLLVIVFIGVWIFNGFPTLNIYDVVLYRTPHYEFFIDFLFDKITAVYLFVGAFLSFLVTIYSRYYLHREKGYKRFFNTILFFYLGYNLVIISGNLETLFIGWEILGISSFLLIAFYRDRYLPVKNAVKVFSIYRIADVGLIMAMWMSHHLWNENITFLKLSQYELVDTQLTQHSMIGVFISLMILISAAAKSAQLPFSSWLPRAMEGPTPSSAIFYGSLSVHMGIFLLLRTFPFWEHQLSVRILIGVLGAVTALVATGIARVQSSVKSQIAYASIAQIGLIFIEVAAGLDTLALIHFAGNAFLRTYQLLVSPSVVSYLIREQLFTFNSEVAKKSNERNWLSNTFYLLCLKEFNIDSMLYKYLWNPMKWFGNHIAKFSLKGLWLFFGITFIIGLSLTYYESQVPGSIHTVIPTLFAFIGLVMVVKAFVERKSLRTSWLMILMNHFWIALAVSFNEHFSISETVMFLSGIVVAGVIGYMVIMHLKKLEKDVHLDQFHGYSFRHPKTALVFLIACLMVAGFPISPTFIGEDLIISHIHEHQIVLAFIVALSFIMNGLALIRMYARVFLGPHSELNYEIAYRSS